MKAPTVTQVRKALPESAAPLVQAVIETATAQERSVFLVGGPVRDLLLGRALRDVDLLVEPKGEEGAVQLARAAAPDGARVVSHGRFGTVSITLDAGSVDLATARRETYAHPGALPQVEPGLIEDDLRRRDFTINALALPLTPAARAGRPAILAPEGGLEDLAAGALRVFHGRSFHDDPTRAVRAARLADRLGFRLARGSRTVLRDALREGAFARVSGDRWRREFEKLFEDARQDLDPASALRRLASWHVLAALEPGLELPRAAMAPLRRLGRSLAEPPWEFHDVHPWVPGLAVWLGAMTSGLRRRTLRRLNVRGERAKRIAGFGAARTRWLAALGRARGRGAIDRVLGAIDDDQLLALVAGAETTDRRKILRYAREDRPRRAPVSGADLVALGLDGPAVGRALARIRAAHLDRAVRTREEALALAREIARRSGRRQAG